MQLKSFHIGLDLPPFPLNNWKWLSRSSLRMLTTMAMIRMMPMMRMLMMMMMNPMMNPSFVEYIPDWS